MAQNPESAKRHVSRVTPLVQVASYLPGLLLFVLIIGGQALLQVSYGVLILLALIAGLSLLALGYEYLAFQRLKFWFDADGDLRVQSGVIAHQERRLQLSRLQTVDINRPLVARVFGYAAVVVEVAGAGDSRVTLKYLTSDDAESLRSEILARSAGLSHDAGAAPERPLLVVPTKDLLVSLLLRAATLLLALVTIFVVISTVWLSGWTGLFTALSGGIPLVVVIAEFVQLYNFTIAESPDGIRLRHGLLQTQARTIPPGRVCAVEFVEPLLWRRRGWVRLQVTVAGVQKSEDDAGTESVLLPVAPREVAEDLFARVMPGADPHSVVMQRPDGPVRRRSPIQWRQLTAGVSPRISVATCGRITRRTYVVDNARVQSVRLTQGPWERMLGLASVHLDLPPGRLRPRMLHFGAAQAEGLARETINAMRHARAADKSTRWMQD